MLLLIGVPVATGTVPLGEPIEEAHQYTLFEFFDDGGIEQKQKKNKMPKCRIFDWRGNKQSILYESLAK